MNRTKIEWCNFTINPIKGLCPMHCKTPDGYEYCYAAGERGLYKRFGWNPEIRWDETVFRVFPPQSKVFIGSTMELFGDWVPSAWFDLIYNYCEGNPSTTFIFLTKKPENLIKYSPFPPNCWVGVSCTNEFDFMRHFSSLERIEAKVKFYSFEPLLGWQGVQGFTELLKQSCNWLIIGQQTKVSAKTVPKIEWIQEIEAAANYADIPVFEKNNLKDLIKYPLRQEFPKL